MSPDIGNAAFQLVGGFFIWLSVIKLHRDKMVRGVHWAPILFFLSLGFWNLYFYPAVGARYSFFAGINVAASNAVWWGQMVYYMWRERKGYRWVTDDPDMGPPYWVRCAGEDMSCPSCGGMGQDHSRNCPHYHNEE